MSDRQRGPIDDDGPVAPPIPSFESLRGPRRRSALDLLLAPAEPPAAEPEAAEPVPAEPVPEESVPALEESIVALDELATGEREPDGAQRPASRPAEWRDLLALGTRLGGCAARLLGSTAARGVAGLRSLLRG